MSIKTQAIYKRHLTVAVNATHKRILFSEEFYVAQTFGTRKKE